MKINPHLRAALIVLALAFAMILSACAQVGATPTANVPTPTASPEPDLGSAGVSGLNRSGDPSAVAATVQTAVSATMQAQPKPADSPASLAAAAAIPTPFAYDGPQPRKSYAQDTGNDTIAYDLGVNNSQVGIAYGDALQWGTQVFTDTTAKGCAFVVLTRGWFDRFTITNGGYAVFTLDANFHDQGVRAVTEQQAAMLAMKGCPARTASDIDQLASDHPSPPGFDLNEPTDNNVVAHPVKGPNESTGKEHSFTRTINVANDQVGLVFGIQIKYNGNEIGDRTSGCALSILRPGMYPDVYVLDGRYEVYSIDPNDYEFWLEDLAVKRADEQTANYGCPKKVFAEIAQWTPETTGMGATDSSVVAPTPAPAGAAAPTARAAAPAPTRTRPRPTTAAAAPKNIGGEDNTHGRNGRLRRASGSGATLAFEPGDEVIGYKIVVDGVAVCDGGNCHVTNAAKSGQVVDGVVNPWAKEVPAGAKEVDLNAAAAAPQAPAEPTAAAAVAPPATGGEDDNHGRNGRVRIATGGGKSHDFAPGDEVVGYRIVVGGTVLCDGGDCHWASATSAGTVTDGVINPWSGELPSSPKEVAGR